MTILRPVFILVVCTGLLLSFLRYQESVNIINNNPMLTKQEIPEFFLDQSITTKYDKEGAVDYQLNSEHIDYFKNSDTTQAKTPYFILFNKDGLTWHTRADHATLLNKNKKIQLNGNVRIWQPTRNLELSTEELFFTETRGFAETKKNVTIKSAIGITHSIGMNLDLTEERLQLLSTVTGNYHVKK